MARELDEGDLGRLDHGNRDCASDTHSDLYSELSSADRHEGSGSEDTVRTDLSLKLVRRGFETAGAAEQRRAHLPVCLVG
jgi:hypothetical protein